MCMLGEAADGASWSQVVPQLDREIATLSRNKDAAEELAAARQALWRAEEDGAILGRKNRALTSQVEQKDASIASLERKLADGKGERERLEKGKIEAEGRADLLNRQVVSMTAAQARLERQTADASTRLATLQEDFTAQSVAAERDMAEQRAEKDKLIERCERGEKECQQAYYLFNALCQVLF